MNKLAIGFFVSTLVMNYLYPMYKNSSVGYIDKQHKLDVSPSKWAFSIWSIIYIFLGYSIFKNNNWDDNSTYLFIGSSIFNMLWIITWINNDTISANLALVGIVLSLASLWFRNIGKNDISQNAIALYLAWCFGALFINSNINLKRYYGLEQSSISNIIILCLCFVQIFWQLNGSSKQYYSDSIPVPLVGIWTSLAIATNGKTPNHGYISLLVSLLASLNHYRKIN